MELYYKGSWYLKVWETTCYLANGNRGKGCGKRVGQGMNVSGTEAQLPIILSRKVKDAKDHPGWFAAPSGYITLPKTNKN